MLNELQQYAYDLIIQGKNVFITGAGGVGKTHTVKEIYKVLSRYKSVGLTSTTGTSAITLWRNIKKLTGQNAEVIVFLDREQHASEKFEKLGIKARSVYKITDIARYLHQSEAIDKNTYDKVMSYVDNFKNRKSYSSTDRVEPQVSLHKPPPSSQSVRIPASVF